jgi:hypothetical protein
MEVCGSTCLHCIQQVLRGDLLLPVCSSGSTAVQSCMLVTIAPSSLTILHAAALSNNGAAVPAALRRAATTCTAAAALELELDGGPKYHLHILLGECGIVLTEGKKPSKFYRRLHGATPLEAAVALGHHSAAAALLAAGAAVRHPQAWTALLGWCPAGPTRDAMARLLVGGTVSWRLPAPALSFSASRQGWCSCPPPL